MIYFDHAATTPLCDAVKEQIPILLDKFANPSSQYNPARDVYGDIYDAEREILSLLGVSPAEYNIYFTSGATESNNWALRSFAETRGKKCTIISSEIEHPSVYNTITDLSGQGKCKAYFAKTKGNGLVDVEDLIKLSYENNRSEKLVSIMAVNNQLGTVQPINDIGFVCKRAMKNEDLFHVDATQAIGHMDIKIKESNIDLLSASAHKFGGMKGVGFLICKKNLNIRPMITGGKQNKGKRAGTENVIGILTTATALRESMKDLNAKRIKIESLKNHILNGLEPGSFVLNSNAEESAPNILNISLRDIFGDTAALYLESKEIYVSTTSACESGEKIMNRVLAACGFDTKRINGALRISLSDKNTIEECDELIKAINYINRDWTR